jgi:hypothetical protein
MGRKGSVMAPGRSTAVLVRQQRAEYINRTDQPEGDKCDGGSRGSPIVLRARESRVHGEEARQVELPVQGNIPCTQR